MSKMTVGSDQNKVNGQPDIHQLLSQLASYQPGQSSVAGSSVSAAPLANIILQPPSSLPSDSSGSILPQIRGASQISNLARTQDSTPTPALAPIPKAPTINPGTITEWPQALRYVNKYVATNPQFESTVRNMIRDQHKHEKEWWESRKEFLIDQVSRDESSAQIESILRSVGGVVASTMGSTAEEKSQQLKQFDLKIVRAAEQMYRSFADTLTNFKVPFFAVSDEYIVTEEFKSPMDKRKTVTPEQLIGLKRKMVTYLEDMYRYDC